MAIDDADAAPELEGEVAEAPEVQSTGAVVGEYTWDDFLREHGHEDAAAALYERFDEAPGSERWGETETTVGQKDWERTTIDPATYLGFPPWELEARIGAAHRVAEQLTESSPLIGYEQTPVIKDIYGWADYEREYFLDDEGNPPTDSEGEEETFDPSEALGFDPEDLGTVMADHERAGEELLALVDERTVDVNDNVDEEDFFTDEQGRVTVANRYDLEKTVPAAKKSHFREEDRYWVNEPYSFIVIFHSTKENEKKYYVIEPHLNEIETDLKQYLSDKLRAAIKYEREGTTAGDEDHRRSVIEAETRQLLDRYELYDDPESGKRGHSLGNTIANKFNLDPNGGLSGRLVDLLGYTEPISGVRQLEGIEARPEPVLLEENADILSEYQVEKLLYYLERDFIGYERIDGIKHDINVEDISCDGYNSPVFVYHSEYEQIISNVYHGETELDDFVVKLAQRSGKGISKRRPQVDATLPDGSRAQLTLGREVSDHGTNYTIRQFKDVPFTPVDLINWKTFSLDQMAFLWLCIENDKSLIFAGGTASGKTTSLNAVSLFIPSNTKIVSIEDTREVELPQRNWIASVTRPSFTDDDKGDVDEFDLLEAALRQRPDYIVMGEVRGEEGRDLFQVMSTGHTSYSTFHADNVGEVLKRFTTEPINVSKTMFTALDLVSVQSSTRVQGHKVRRNKSLTEINHYDAENDEINVKDVYQWQAETDEFLRIGDSNTLDEIMFDRGWSREELDLEIFKRQVVLAYLIDRGLNTYTQVAATFQAFINDPETILTLMANEQLESSLEDLREMESVLIDIDPEKEEMVPRPDPSDEIAAECTAILERAEEELFDEFRGEVQASVAEALIDTEAAPDIEVTTDMAGELPEGEEPTDASGPEADEPGEDQAALDDVDPGELEDDPADAMPALSAGEEEEATETAVDDEEPDIGETTDEFDTDEFDAQIGFPSEDEGDGIPEADESGPGSTLDEDHEPDFKPFDPLSEEGKNGTGGPGISAGDADDAEDISPPDEPVVLGEPEPSDEAEQSDDADPAEGALSSDESIDFESESTTEEEFGQSTDDTGGGPDADTDPFTDDGTFDDEPSFDEEPTLDKQPEVDDPDFTGTESNFDNDPEIDEAESSLDDEPDFGEAEPSLGDDPDFGEAESNFDNDPEIVEAESGFDDDPDFGEAESNFDDESDFGEAEPSLGDDPDFGEADSNMEDEPDVSEAESGFDEESDFGEGPAVDDGPEFDDGSESPEQSEHDKDTIDAGDSDFDDEPSLGDASDVDEGPTIGEEPEPDADSSVDHGSDFDQEFGPEEDEPISSEEPAFDEESTLSQDPDPDQASSLDDESGFRDEPSFHEEPALGQDPELNEDSARDEVSDRSEGSDFEEEPTLGDTSDSDSEPAFEAEAEADADAFPGEETDFDTEPRLDEASTGGEEADFDTESEFDERPALNDEPVPDQESNLDASPAESQDEGDATDENSESIWGGGGDWDDLAAELEKEGIDDEIAEVDSWDAGEEEDEE